jgi:hypothetical protein
MDSVGNMLSSQMMSTQMLSMAFMKDNVSIYQVLFALFMMQIMAFIPHIKKMAGEYFSKKFAKAQKSLMDTPLLKNVDEKTIKSSICFKKLGGSGSAHAKGGNVNTNFTIDALNFYITNINESVNLEFIKDYYVTNKEEFEIAKNIYCKVNTSVATESDDINYTITVYSYELSLEELKSFMDDLKKKYMYEQKNKLGKKKFYFDEYHIHLPKNQDGTIRFESAPHNMTFTMTEFNTNKSLSNVFGTHLDIVKERIDLFVNHPEWYQKKGIPYTLGVLLHGPPGTGKTSLIKSIAKDTKRHIFNIKLQPDSTQSQLRNLFFNERISVLGNGKTEVYNIPLDERIYVIEDIDCLSDVVHKRSSGESNLDMASEQNNENMTYDQTSGDLQPFNGGDMFAHMNYGGSHATISDTQHNTEIKPFKQNKTVANDSEKLNLSFLLNLLDGILETPGRILIITTNHPEKLDPALIRPGRIDINIEVGYCDVKMINDIYTYFFDGNCNALDIDESDYVNKLTPASMNKLLLDNFNDSDAAKEAILKEIFENQNNNGNNNNKRLMDQIKFFHKLNKQF